MSKRKTPRNPRREPLRGSTPPARPSLPARLLRARIPAARLAALDGLSRVLDQGEDVQAALDAVLTRTDLSTQDAGLCTELVYGFLRLMGRLDRVRDSFLRNPAKVPPLARRILSLAALELGYLTRVPAYATLDWAVEAIKAAFGTGLSRLANGVLRNIDRLGEEQTTPDFFRRSASDDISYFVSYYSLPRWIVELWQREYGETAVEYMEASLHQPPLGVRVNFARDGAAALLERLADAPGVLFQRDAALAFGPGSRPLSPEDFDNGAVSLQSAASQQALFELAPATWPAPVWDCCCGRGGKSLALVERGLGPLLSSDVNLPRLAGLVADQRRLGLISHPVFAARGESPPPLHTSPRTVLIDAPCSGLGVLSRRPDTRWKRRPEDLPPLIALQSRLLDNALETVPRRGLVAYITCTLNPDENERRIRDALSRHDAELVTEFRTPPDSLQSDALDEFFYAALLRRV